MSLITDGIAVWSYSSAPKGRLVQQGFVNLKRR